MTREPIAEGEWYHCYNRGVDKRTIFQNKADFERFLMLLYVSNSTKPVRLSNIAQGKQGPTLLEVLAVERGEKLVEIGAYCLMSNHFHILVRPLAPGAMGTFMQKVSTGYSMYFNKKYDRTGTLFQGKFKSKRIDKDTYMRRIVNYIHANPAELFEPGWKKGIVRDERALCKKLSAYAFSSLPDYLKNKSVIVDLTALQEMVEQPIGLEDLLADAADFAKSS